MDSRSRLLVMPSAARVLLLPTLFSLATCLPWSGSQAELLRRNDVESTICGWREADFTKPASCSSGTTCVYDTLHQIVGCCPDSGPCTTGIYTSCVDNDSANTSLSGPNILTCSGTSVCYQDSYPGGYRRYGCGAYGDEAVVATTYVGQQIPTSLQVKYTALSLAPAEASSTGPASVGSASITGSTQSSTLHVVTVMATSTAPAVTATVSAVEATGHSNQASAGIIVGGVVGGLSFAIGVLALACFLLRRRRRRTSKQEIGSERIMRDLTSENTSIEVVKDTSSVISSASSSLSDLTQVHPFSPDDVGGSQVSFAQSEKLSRLPTPPLQSHPAMQGEMAEIVSPVTATSFVEVPLDDLADLPAPWTRPPTPPPRSPKRLLWQGGQSRQIDAPSNDEQIQPSTSMERTVQMDEAKFPQAESLAPLELYLASPVTTFPRSQSTLSSASGNSRYSRTSDGHSMAGGSRARDDWSAYELPPMPPMPPMPIIRKPVGGWYRTPSTQLRNDGHKHIGYHMIDGARLERDIITALPQTRQRSASGPEPTSEVQVGNTQGLKRYISEGRRRDHGDLAVAPLTLDTPTVSEIQKKRRGSPVPILSVPAAPSVGEREKRLYDIQGNSASCI